MILDDKRQLLGFTPIPETMLTALKPAGTSLVENVDQLFHGGVHMFSRWLELLSTGGADGLAICGPGGGS